VKQYIDITVTVPSDVRYLAEASAARNLVRAEAERQGFVIDVQPQGPHTFADDGISLRKGEGDRVYVGHVRTRADVQCVATVKGRQCQKAAVGRGFIGPVCFVHRKVGAPS
jgi:hypothetical protein